MVPSQDWKAGAQTLVVSSRTCELATGWPSSLRRSRHLHTPTRASVGSREAYRTGPQGGACC